MKAAEIFGQIGNKLANHYKDFGFKYTKKWGVKKETEEYQYILSFHSAEGNTKKRVALFVNIAIYCKTVRNRYNDPTQLFYIDLWKLGNYYEIGESHTIEQAFEEICNVINVLLIPFIDIFENQEKEHLTEWVTKGFLSKIPKGLYQYSHLDYTTHKHYWIGSKFSEENNDFGFTISLRYILEKFGRDNAEKCLNNYYQSLNDNAKKNFLNAYQSEKISTTKPWESDYQNMPDVEIVKYSVQQDLKLY